MLPTHYNPPYQYSETGRPQTILPRIGISSRARTEEFIDRWRTLLYCESITSAHYDKPIRVAASTPCGHFNSHNITAEVRYYGYEVGDRKLNIRDFPLNSSPTSTKFPDSALSESEGRKSIFAAIEAICPKEIIGDRDMIKDALSPDTKANKTLQNKCTKLIGPQIFPKLDALLAEASIKDKSADYRHEEIDSTFDTEEIKDTDTLLCIKYLFDTD